ncbi:MAG: ABC transporter permease [Gemmatimonadetes bacterium]|nr:ABC transporter permease [Gemmatimonadota bacterium]
MVRNLRHAVRGLVRTPGYTVAFVLTLGLGIGLNTAIFSVVNGVLLEPLPYQDADRILYVRQPAVQAGVRNARFSFNEVQDYRERSRTIDQFVEYGDWSFTVVGDDAQPHRAVGGLVTSNYFDVLGLTPAIGRLLGPQDDGDDAEPAALLTHDYWTRVFGADPDVIGKTVRLYAFSAPTTTRIVGVLEPGTHYTGSGQQDFFVNYATNEHYQSATMQDQRNHRMTDIFARLAPGQSAEAAQAELKALQAPMLEQFPDAYPDAAGFDIVSALWQDELTRDARPTFLILMGTVALVLLLACANVANLTLTRIVRREKEFAVRAALGAGRGRLRRQLLTENLVLSLAGAGLGLLLAVSGLDLLVQYANRFTVRTGEIGIEVPVLLFTIGIAVGVAVLLAWAPSLPGVQGLGNAAGAAGSARGVVGLSKKHLQRLLAVSQLALSFTLLIGAGLMVRSLVNLTTLDTGIAYENVVTMQAPNTTGMSAPENLLLMDQVVEEIRQFPGVRTVAHASRAPWSPNTVLRPLTVRVEGLDPEGVVSPMVQRNFISPEYFQTVGIPLVAGRGFMTMDDASSDTVAIINERMAQDLFPNEDPINRRIAAQNFNGTWGAWTRIVGVAADTREYGLSVAGAHTIYRPAAQGIAGQSLIVSTSGEPGPLARRVSEIVGGLDADRPVDNVTTLSELRAENIAPERLNATLFAAFALLALVIAAIGVLGVLAFGVSQRTREFGVRMALGAERGQVLRMVLREGALLAGGALLVGGVAAATLSRFLVGLLYEVEATDPATYAGVGVILAIVALLAAYVPAKQATRVDPMEALRSE